MKVNLCRHIKTNGLQCHGVALNGSVFCYFHRRLHRSHDLYRDKAYLQPGLIAHDPFLKLPAMEDRESIQIAISTVVNALATGCITEQRAYALYKGLRLASGNARAACASSAARSKWFAKSTKSPGPLSPKPTPTSHPPVAPSKSKTPPTRSNPTHRNRFRKSSSTCPRRPSS